MSAGELRHRVGLRARGGDLERVESLRRRDGEERRVDQRHAPFLAIRRGDHEAQASYAHLRVLRVRVRRAEIEAPDHGIPALGEDLSPRQLRSGAVRLELAGEANSLGVIAPVAKRRARWRSEAVNKLLRRQTLGREPSGRVGESCGAKATTPAISASDPTALRGVGRNTSGNVRSPSDSSSSLAQRAQASRILGPGLCSSLHPHIIPRRVADRLELAAARLAGGDLFRRLGGEPCQPVGPPGAGRLLGGGDPRVELALWRPA